MTCIDMTYGYSCLLIIWKVIDKNEEFQQAQTKTQRENKIGGSLVDKLEHVLLLVDFC